MANTARRMTGRKLSHASSVSRRGTVAVYLDFGFFRFKQFSINAHSGYYYMRAEYITHVRNISISHSTSASQQGTHNKQRRPSHDSNAKSTLHFYPLKNVKSNACSRPFFLLALYVPASADVRLWFSTASWFLALKSLYCTSENQKALLTLTSRCKTAQSQELSCTEYVPHTFRVPHYSRNYCIQLVRSSIITASFLSLFSLCG